LAWISKCIYRRDFAVSVGTDTLSGAPKALAAVSNQIGRLLDRRADGETEVRRLRVRNVPVAMDD
jgi:hypothetical protein